MYIRVLRCTRSSSVREVKEGKRSGEVAKSPKFEVVEVKNDFESINAGKKHYRSLTLIVNFTHMDEQLGELSMLCEMQVLPRTAWDISHDTHRWYTFGRLQDGCGADAGDVFTGGPGSEPQSETYETMELRVPGEPGLGKEYKPAGWLDGWGWLQLWQVPVCERGCLRGAVA
jgi:hypothetical protein